MEMPENLPIPFIDYFADSEKAKFIHIRVLEPEKCDEHPITKDPGRAGHLKLRICRAFGKKTTTTQAMLVDKGDWDDDEYIRKQLEIAIKMVQRREPDRKVCVSGLNEEDRKRFKDLTC